MYDMLNKEMLTYIAGLFDGEGTICLLHSEKTKQTFLCVNITSKNKEVLDLINKSFGGKISIISYDK